MTRAPEATEWLSPLLVPAARVLPSNSEYLAHLDIAAIHVGQVGNAVESEERDSDREQDLDKREFMREANTLCSKSASAALTSTGLDLKAVIDQFREQVQNVE